MTCNQIRILLHHKSFNIHYLPCLRNVQSCDKPISGGGVLPITRQSTFTLLDRWKVALHHFLAHFPILHLANKTLSTEVLSRESIMEEDSLTTNLSMWTPTAIRSFPFPRCNQFLSQLISQSICIDENIIQNIDMMIIDDFPKIAFWRLRRSCSTKIDAKVVTPP